MSDANYLFGPLVERIYFNLLQKFMVKIHWRIKIKAIKNATKISGNVIL